MIFYFVICMLIVDMSMHFIVLMRVVPDVTDLILDLTNRVCYTPHQLSKHSNKRARVLTQTTVHTFFWWSFAFLLASE